MFFKREPDFFDPVAMLEHVYNIMDSPAIVTGSNSPNITLPRFPESAIKHLIAGVKQIFLSQKTLISLTSPIVVVGDLHGNVHDLMRIIRHNGAPPWKRYLFLGDMVDRGKFSLETVVSIFLMVYNFPQDVFIVRGNHEVRDLCAAGGFRAEIVRKYGTDELFHCFVSAFDMIPIGALVDARILCVHGGIGPKVTSLRSIANVRRPLTKVSKNQPQCDILWSDPFEGAYKYVKSPRGLGHLYGAAHVAEFEERNNVSIIVRGHEMVNNGVNFCFDGRLVTVFSASNYCGNNNDGGVLRIEQGCHVSADTYKPLKFPPKEETATYIDVKLETKKIPLGVASIVGKHGDYSSIPFLNKRKPDADGFVFVVPNQFIMCKHEIDKGKRLKKYVQREEIKEHESENKSVHVELSTKPHTKSKKKRASSTICDRKRVIFSKENLLFPDSAASLPHNPESAQGKKKPQRQKKKKSGLSSSHEVFINVPYSPKQKSSKEEIEEITLPLSPREEDKEKAKEKQLLEEELEKRPVSPRPKKKSKRKSGIAPSHEVVIDVPKQKPAEEESEEPTLPLSPREEDKEKAKEKQELEEEENEKGPVSPHPKKKKRKAGIAPSHEAIIDAPKQKPTEEESEEPTLSHEDDKEIEKEKNEMAEEESEKVPVSQHPKKKKRKKKSGEKKPL